MPSNYQDVDVQVHPAVNATEAIQKTQLNNAVAAMPQKGLSDLTNVDVTLVREFNGPKTSAPDDGDIFHFNGNEDEWQPANIDALAGVKVDLFSLKNVGDSNDIIKAGQQFTISAIQPDGEPFWTNVPSSATVLKPLVDKNTTKTLEGSKKFFDFLGRNTPNSYTYYVRTEGYEVDQDIIGYNVDVDITDQTKWEKYGFAQLAARHFSGVEYAAVQSPQHSFGPSVTFSLHAVKWFHALENFHMIELYSGKSYTVADLDTIKDFALGLVPKGDVFLPTTQYNGKTKVEISDDFYHVCNITEGVGMDGKPKKYIQVYNIPTHEIMRGISIWPDQAGTSTSISSYTACQHYSRWL